MRSTFDSVSEFGTGDVYLNFTGRDDEALGAGVSDQFGRNLDRLAQVKARVRPGELLPAQQQHRAEGVAPKRSYSPRRGAYALSRWR